MATSALPPKEKQSLLEGCNSPCLHSEVSLPQGTLLCRDAEWQCLVGRQTERAAGTDSPQRGIILSYLLLGSKAFFSSKIILAIYFWLLTSPSAPCSASLLSHLTLVESQKVGGIIHIWQMSQLSLQLSLSRWLIWEEIEISFKLKRERLLAILVEEE